MANPCDNYNLHEIKYGGLLLMKFSNSSTWCRGVLRDTCKQNMICTNEYPHITNILLPHLFWQHLSSFATNVQSTPGELLKTLANRKMRLEINNYKLDQARN